MPEASGIPEGRARENDRLGAWGAAVRHGVDVSLLEESLRKTPEQRLRDHCRSLRLAQALREAKSRSE